MKPWLSRTSRPPGGSGVRHLSLDGFESSTCTGGISNPFFCLLLVVEGDASNFITIMKATRIPIPNQDRTSLARTRMIDRIAIVVFATNATRVSARACARA